MKVKNEREVVQSHPTLRNPMDRSLQGSSVHGIFQARVLEWGAIAFSVILCHGHLKKENLRKEPILESNKLLMILSIFISPTALIQHFS